MRLVRPLALTLVIAGCVAPRPAARVTPRPAVASAPAAAADAGDAGVPEEIVTLGYGKRTRRDPSDLCEPVEENLTRAASAIVSEDRSAAAPAQSRPWDKQRPPKYLDLVERRFALTPAEKALLRKNGFVVPARIALRGYADALHDVYQSQLPIYVSSDAILHAIYKGNDVVMADIERTLLAPLEAALAKMDAALASAPYPAVVKDDLALYLSVARALLAAPDDAPALAASATPFVESAQRGNEGLRQVTLFGRARMIDWSQYAPRGHYAGDPELERWFRGTMWLSRLELNLVSRKSRSSQPGIVPNPEETPREAVDALALAELAERAGVVSELDRVERAWTELAGKREDVSIDDLNALRRRAGITAFTIPDAADKLKAAIGNDFQRTARVHYMPQGSTPLPAIATMLGPRIVPDTQIEKKLVHAAIPDRAMPSFADVAFLLGSDRAKAYAAADLARFPALLPALEQGRAEMKAIPTTNLYGAWLAAIRELNETPNGVVPSYMKTAAYADFKLGSTVAAYGQLRHDYVLVAGQAYDEGGCEIPDGYVEPNLALYESLVTYAQRGGAAAKALGATKETIEYFARLEKTLGVLVALVKDELAGRPLSEEEKRWLSMASEIVPPSSDGPGSNDGWYFDLFPESAHAFAEHAFVADWFTSSNASAVVYAGAREPRLGVFVVDANGEPRVMVGPVARAFEHVGSLEGRLQDKDASKIGALKEPWAASYTAPDPGFPPVAALSMWREGDAPEEDLLLRSTRDIGPLTIELLDGHYLPLGKETVTVGPTWKKVRVKMSQQEWVPVIRLRSGERTTEIRDLFGSFAVGLGGMPTPDWEDADKVRQRFTKQPGL